MAPSNRRELINQNKYSKKPRPSSVLIILYPDEHNKIATVFIKRVDYEGVHSGQIAFPGGKHESVDKGMLQTALRETKEEIGIEIKETEVVGKLTDLYVPPSNFIISPFVAVLKTLPKLKPNEIEVAEIFSAPVSHFLSSDSRTFQQCSLSSGIEIEVPGYSFGKYFIWGATAMIFTELIQIMNDLNNQ
ncbi:MAG: CoA pyrophosphatase [Lentimicrobium sp.]|nr:CoA pyrophosphatase [Lentimicrobium sp.]